MVIILIVIVRSPPPVGGTELWEGIWYVVVPPYPPGPPKPSFDHAEPGVLPEGVGLGSHRGVARGRGAAFR